MGYSPWNGKESDTTEQLTLSLLRRIWASLMAQMEENLPASARTTGDLGSISGSERSLEKKMATHSSIRAWRIPWTEEPGELPSMGSQRVGHD